MQIKVKIIKLKKNTLRPPFLIDANLICLRAHFKYIKKQFLGAFFSNEKRNMSSIDTNGFDCFA